MAKAILKGVKIVKVDEIIIPDESDINELVFLEKLNENNIKPVNELPTFDNSSLMQLGEKDVHVLDVDGDYDTDDDGDLHVVGAPSSYPDGEVVLVDEDYIINQVRLALRNGDRVSITKQEDSEDDN